MALAAARTTVVKQAIKPHVPSIKFPPRSSTPPIKEHIGTAVGKPDELDQLFNTAIPRKNTDPLGCIGPAVETSQIPQRYRRKPLTKEEMEIIEKGGPA